MKKEKILRYSHAFLLPVVILAVVYLIMELTSFGNDTLLTTDMNGQYVAFFSYLQDSILGDQSLFYSFSKTMSGEMAGLTGYYLMSPFNLLFLFVPKTSLPQAITIVTFLKTGTAGLTMYFYLTKKDFSKPANLLLSTTYALSAYSVVYQQNIMWLEGVILLPLVIHGIDIIIYSKKISITYAVFLSLTLITNYYIGYMVCIFSVIYFTASMVGQMIDHWGVKFSTHAKEIGKRAGNFALQSLVAGGLAAFLLLPVWFSLQGGKAEFDLAALLQEFVMNFSLLDFLSKFVLGAFSYDEKVSGLPNVFVSLFVIILAMVFIFNHKIKFSSKVKSVLLLAALYFSFKVNFFNLIWHGMNSPTWFPYRYSFMFSFVLIIIAAKQIKSGYYSRKALVSSSLFILLMLAMVHINDYEFLRLGQILVTALFVLAWTVVLWAFRDKNKSTMRFLSLSLIFVELAVNGLWILTTNNYNELGDFTHFVGENKAIMNQYKRKGDEFYRVEKNYHYAQNDPLMLGYEGLSHHSSNEKDGVKDFLGNMGYAANVDYSRFSDGSSVPADSFMGIRFLISDRSLSQYPLVNVIKDAEDKYVYENPYYFPLGFHTTEDLSGTLSETNPFEFQNDLFYETFGSQDLFQPVDEGDISWTTENLEPAQDQDHRYHFEKEDEDEDAYLNYEISNVDSDFMSFYFESDLNDGVEVSVNGNDLGENLTSYNHTIDTYKTDADTVRISLELQDDEIYFDDLHFYGHNEEDMAQLKSMAEENKLTITEFNQTHIQGTVNNEAESTLMMTMPYDDSWQVTVDGEEVTTFPVFDTLMGIELPAGSEEVELRFVPKGFIPGLIISLGSGFVLAAYYWAFKRNEDE